eukprot:366161_1
MSFNEFKINSTFTTTFMYGTAPQKAPDWGLPLPVPGVSRNYLSLIFGSIAGAIIIIIMTIFIINSIKIECSQNKNKAKNKKMNKKPLYLAIAIFTAYILLSATAISQAILIFKASEHYHILSVIGNIINSIAMCLVYSFMILRLYDTFESTMYEITKLFLISHIIVAIYYAIGCSLIPVVILHKNIKRIAKLFYIIIVIIPVTIGLIHLIYSFNSKLFALVLLQRKTLISSNDSNNLNDRQLKLLSTIRKHSILGGFMILSGFIVLIYCIVFYGLKNIDHDTHVIVYWIVNDICIILTSTCLFIGFTQHSKIYMCLCKHCDNQCTNMCIKLATNQMKAKNSKETFGVLMTEHRNSESETIEIQQTH